MKMSAILKERDHIESFLEVLFSDINPDGSSRDPNRDIDGESVPLMNEVTYPNRDIITVTTGFYTKLMSSSSSLLKRRVV
jgi:hypothetical protein